MAITQLPRATVHLLGSTQVLTTPSSLVKELIDNALDARATSIDILISEDTLDKIEVRDNGHGIAKEDLEALGRRGYTSKLRCFEELRELGGSTLGFRGEALASAVQLGEVSVTTKTNGDPTATIVKLKESGGISQQSRVSGPLGTTVSVAKFMFKIPVRKQTALKTAPKTLAKIKELLYSYALARPSIRFSLKVVKRNKGAWSFAPRPNDGIREAVSQVIGRDAANQCLETARTFAKPRSVSEISREFAGDIAGSMPAQVTESLFQMHAFMPRPDADPAKVGSSQYISIDSRPVACDKGTMKKIVTIFKKYAQNRVSQGSQDKLKNPFLRLSIICPSTSYDPNVEPAKDDVLFADEQLVLESAEELFKEVYGSITPLVPATSVITAEKLDSFELLLNRSSATDLEVVKELSTSAMSGNMFHKHNDNDTTNVDFTTEIFNPPIAEQLESTPISILSSGSIGPPSMQDEPFSELGVDPDAVPKRKRQWNFDMSKDFAEDVSEEETQLSSKHVTRHSDPQVIPNELGQDVNNGLNPWVIAKLNAPVRESGRQNLPASADINTFEGVHDIQLDDVTRQGARYSQSYGNTVSIPEMARDRNTSPLMLFPRTLPKDAPQQDLQFKDPDDDPILLEGDSRAEVRKATDFISARRLQQDSLLSPPATQHGGVLKRLMGPNKPFVSPIRPLGPVRQAETLRQTRLGTESQIPHKSSNTSFPHEEEPAGDLSWAMQYEERKEEATRRRREEVRLSRQEATRQAQTDSPRSSPHKNRYEAAIASLEAAQATEEVPKSRMRPGDPRAYLMRRQKSLAVESEQPGVIQKLKRVKTNMLPLETTYHTDIVYSLVQTINFDLAAVRKLVRGLRDVDPYVTEGIQTFGVDETAANAVRRKLEYVAKFWLEDKAAAGKHVEQDFAQ
ncbi:hypothetical protein BP5796_07417 [Coleophoma crateriformis]|uniref:DNA mismatch repair protein S5 domain-containing protein n=1 Tax=Coleophoma crateriformis TaxID=565419 RepID=A0A3D8RIV5_9HELO|nr:hypothetical protein BP5796_07417 [Coleophoma crateriformis]